MSAARSPRFFPARFASVVRSRLAGEGRWRGVALALLGIALVGLLLAAGASQATAAGKKPATKAKTTAGKSTATTKKDDADDGDDDKAKKKFRQEKVHEIVLWNEHDGKHHDSGAKKCNLALSREGKVVWHRDNVEVPWEANRSADLVVEVGSVLADKLRVEISEWNGKAGGLSEVEVLDKTGTNLALGGKVTTSVTRNPSDGLDGDALIDGNYYEPTAEVGYWLLPDGQEGWVELELVPQKIPPPAYKPPEKKKGKKVLSQIPMPAEIYISCDAQFDMYVNGVHALSGHGRRCFTREMPIANGDIVTVKCEGTSDTKGGFCFLLKFANSKNFLSTMNGWKTFTPADPEKWYTPDRAAGAATAVTKGKSDWAEKEMKEESGGKPPQIWGTGKTCYLVMVTDTAVTHIKMKPGKPVQRRR